MKWLLGTIFVNLSIFLSRMKACLVNKRYISDKEYETFLDEVRRGN